MTKISNIFFFVSLTIIYFCLSTDLEVIKVTETEASMLLTEITLTYAGLDTKLSVQPAWKDFQMPSK